MLKAAATYDTIALLLVYRIPEQDQKQVALYESLVFAVTLSQTSRMSLAHGFDTLRDALPRSRDHRSITDSALINIPREPPVL